MPDTATVSGFDDISSFDHVGNEACCLFYHTPEVDFGKITVLHAFFEMGREFQLPPPKDGPSGH
jgi:hypothetical protein